MSDEINVDIIGGFPEQSPNCKGCGKPLMLANAWMIDGCPCNSPLGVNSMNEWRWRLLMVLQQKQSKELEQLRAGQRQGGNARTMIAAMWMIVNNCNRIDQQRDAFAQADYAIESLAEFARGQDGKE